MKTLRVVGIVLAVAAVVVVGAFFLTRKNRTVTASDTPTALVTRGNIERTVSATGHIASDKQATLSLEQSGKVVEIAAQEGDAVAAGQALVKLETASLQRSLERAQASLATYQARLAQTKQGASDADIVAAKSSLASAEAKLAEVKAGPTEADLAQVKAALDNAKASLEQAQSAYDKVSYRGDIGALPQSSNLRTATNDYDTALAKFNAAANHPTASELAAAESSVEQAKSKLQSLQDSVTPEAVAVMQAQVDEAAVTVKQAQQQLDEATLRAPYAATVTDVLVNAGEWANAGAKAVAIADMEHMMLEVDVDELDIAQIKPGQPVRITLEALSGQSITGTVRSISAKSSTVSGAVAYSVKVDINDNDLPIRLGMTARVEFTIAEAKEALLVPSRAITSDREAGTYYVTVQRALSTERVEVTIGIKNNSQTQILSGLKEGDVLQLVTVATTTTSESGGGLIPGSPMQSLNSLGGGR